MFLPRNLGIPIILLILVSSWVCVLAFFARVLALENGPIRTPSLAHELKIEFPFTHINKIKICSHYMMFNLTKSALTRTH